MKPIIGIVCKHKNISNVRPNTFIRDEIKDSIFYNGGIAIGIVPPSEKITLVNNENQDKLICQLNKLLSKQEKDNLRQQLELCDGIILQGGAESDAYEMLVAKYCYENNIPTLAICAGQNNMVRGIGGSIKNIDNPESHSQLLKEYVHSISIEENSNFYKIVKTKTIRVNSRHKNVVCNTNCLDVVAFDNDGNIEVVEDKNKTFFLGVRFHPESLYKKDKKHNAIIKAFINACKNRG